MEDEIGKILKNSCKAELLEEFEKLLATADKVIVILVENKENGKYSTQELLLGIEYEYEAYGILEDAKADIQKGHNE